MPEVEHKRTVSIYLTNPRHEGEFLAVKRPEDDNCYPGTWCLPTVTLHTNELPEEAAKRAGREKLRTIVMPLELMNVGTGTQENTHLTNILIKVRLKGPEPSVNEANTKTTHYIEQKWTHDLTLFQELARNGSVPLQALLQYFGMTLNVPEIKTEINTELTTLLNFAHEMYGVKQILRFRGMPGMEDADWDRWDSVAEHSWRMALLGVMLAPHLQKTIDLKKTLKMILVHDIVELQALDYSPIAKDRNAGGHAFDHKAFNEKYIRELNAAGNIFKNLPQNLSLEFFSLFKEYIETKAKPETATEEGKFAYALDKIEASIQIIDWRKTKKNWKKENFEKSMKYILEWSSYDPSLKAFCEKIKKEGLQITE